MLLRNRVLMDVAAPPDQPGAGAGGQVPPPASPNSHSNGQSSNGTSPDAKPAIESITLPKDAFDERIAKAGDAATRRLLKELGFEKADDVREAIKALKSLQDEKKSAQEKLEGRIKELEPKATRADVLAKRFESVVSAEFEKLPENIRTAIDKVADGDAEKRWEQLEVFRAAGVLNAPAASEPPKPAPPANKGPQGAPPPPSSGAPTKFAEWAELRAKNPVRASLFYQLHGPAIEASRPADE